MNMKTTEHLGLIEATVDRLAADWRGTGAARRRAVRAEIRGRLNSLKRDLERIEGRAD